MCPDPDGDGGGPTVDGGAPTADGDDDLDALVATLHSLLVATEHLPLDPRANKWLGEAQALVADLREVDVSEETAWRRLRTVDRLLAEVDDAGEPNANEYLDQAKASLAAALDDQS